MLDELRQQIDAIDKDLLALFETRMQVCRKVGEYKKAHGLPVFQPEREQALLAEKVAQLSDPSLAQVTTQFFEKVMALSRDLQTDIIKGRQTGTVAYAGVPGCYAEEALCRYFGSDATPFATDAFEEVFQAVRDGKADYGVLPVENSSTGSVHDVLDLLYRYPCHIVGEQTVSVSHCLLGLPGASLADIREVYSHEQGLFQCRRFLAEHPDWKQVPYYNTAGSALYVAEQQDPAKAAIASRHAGEIYGLSVLAEDIHFKQENTTRFVIIGRELEMTAASDRVSVLFTLSHQSGTLYRALESFAKCGLNLLHIESRPLPDRNFEYMFFVDFAGNLGSQGVSNALQEMKKQCGYFRVLGCY